MDIRLEEQNCAGKAETNPQTLENLIIIKEKQQTEQQTERSAATVPQSVIQGLY